MDWHEIARDVAKIDAMLKAVNIVFFDVEGVPEMLEKVNTAQTLLDVAMDLVNDLKRDVDRITARREGNGLRIM